MAGGHGPSAHVGLDGVPAQQSKNTLDPGFVMRTGSICYRGRARGAGRDPSHSVGPAAEVAFETISDFDRQILPNGVTPSSAPGSPSRRPAPTWLEKVVDYGNSPVPRRLVGPLAADDPTVAVASTKRHSSPASRRIDLCRCPRRHPGTNVFLAKLGLTPVCSTARMYHRRRPCLRGSQALRGHDVRTGMSEGNV